VEFRPARKVERPSNCLEHLPGEIEMAVKTRPGCPWTKRPRELYCSLAFASFFQLFRIGGSALRTSEIPLFEMSKHYFYPAQKFGKRTVSGGQFDWGGRLLKCNGGVQRLA